ncbi:sex-regulated protein janus-A [Drosophila miranda]|uniref:Sex-regulated protein janus-A n=3 Tax=pseudoobscura subgroup TaxID=32358 RepID=JANA_DROPS|nr:sex-regulated protein janus-A [Drosophila miranda]P54364.2 RecName: Full=Sex-regulated protein janus-A [Drosophila pseudoobscura pseudoobscura]
MLKAAAAALYRKNSNFLQGLRLLHKMSDQDLAKIPLVDIDEEGIFKYILIRVTGKETADGTEPSKLVVRGYADCEWHADIYERTQGTIKGTGLDTECLGGGRIEHNPEKKYLKVYGHSTGYGKADHAESKRVLLTKYKNYEIETSDEGY